MRELAANWLLILKEDPQQSVDHLVARMLNAAWNLGLRDLVAARLKMLEPQVAAKPAVGWSKLSPEELDKRLKAYGPRNAGATDPNPTKPTSPTLPGFNDSPLSQTFKGLERIAEELQKSGQPKSKPAKKDDVPLLNGLTQDKTSGSDKSPAPRKPDSPFPESSDK